ncbi:TPA: 3'(2'),5'-bisphosphate nucleotidase CysQ [Candidatus Woesearchaeota archaeon]|nr:3'(2'),5'-bisphosphate nucleotidase CysQ [Candidatus Woesearchaeota archaeon]
MENYNQEINLARKLAVDAGNAVLPIYYGAMDVSLKADNTPVTNADILANRLIQDGIQHTFPRDGVVSEELESIAGERCWYVDPIDGTRGFVEHTDQFAVHIGLAVDGQAVLGVVYKPVAREIYYAVRGQGAYRLSPLGQAHELRVQEHSSLVAAIDKRDAAGTLYRRIEQELGIERTIISGSEGLRIMKVAEGIADTHFTVNPTACSTWDVCAPLAIAAEAGAYSFFSDGTPIVYCGQKKLGNTFVVANTRDLAEKVSRFLQREN